MKKLRKILLVLQRELIKLISIFSGKYYMKYYVNYLKKQGVDIKGYPNFISTSVYFDGSDYSKIIIEDNVTISMDVMLLTHDGSIHTTHKGLDLNCRDKINIMESKNNSMIIKGIKIGKNSFIGARALILPGSVIGENVIVGAGSVVRGTIPSNSIVIGNPATVICKTDSWIIKTVEKQNL